MTDEDEYFPLPPELRRMLVVLDDLVRAGFGATQPTTVLDDDRGFSASAALAALTT